MSLKCAKQFTQMKIRVISISFSRLQHSTILQSFFHLIVVVVRTIVPQFPLACSVDQILPIRLSRASSIRPKYYISPTEQLATIMHKLPHLGTRSIFCNQSRDELYTQAQHKVQSDRKKNLHKHGAQASRPLVLLSTILQDLLQLGAKYPESATEEVEKIV